MKKFITIFSILLIFTIFGFVNTPKAEAANWNVNIGLGMGGYGGYPYGGGYQSGYPYNYGYPYGGGYQSGYPYNYGYPYGGGFNGNTWGSPYFSTGGQYYPSGNMVHPDYYFSSAGSNYYYGPR